MNTILFGQRQSSLHSYWSFLLQSTNYTWLQFLRFYCFLAPRLPCLYPVYKCSNLYTCFKFIHGFIAFICTLAEWAWFVGHGVLHFSFQTLFIVTLFLVILFRTDPRDTITPSYSSCKPLTSSYLTFSGSNPSRKLRVCTLASYKMLCSESLMNYRENF